MFSLLFFLVFIICFYFGFYSLINNRVCLEILIPYGGLFDISFSFVFDYISLFFFSVVSLVSSVVFFYSRFYINRRVKEVGLTNKRFFFLLFFFVVSIFFLVFSGSWVVVILGWDGLGLVSFLLVIFYNNNLSLDSGLVTVFTNRLGDCFFILSFIFIFFFG